MKMNFNLSAQVEKLAEAFNIKEGSANINCNLELEYSVEEFIELVKVQKDIIPGVLNFVKEMQELTSKQNYDSEKELEIRNLKHENEMLKRFNEINKEEK